MLSCSIDSEKNSFNSICINCTVYANTIVLNDQLCAWTGDSTDEILFKEMQKMVL